MTRTRLFLICATLLSLDALYACSGDVNVHGIPDHIALTPCVPDAGDGGLPDVLGIIEDYEDASGQ